MPRANRCRSANLPKARRPISSRSCRKSRSSRRATASRTTASRFATRGAKSAFPIWSDSPLAEPCRDEWSPGQFYKLRAVLRQSNYGPQLEIKKIRPVEDGDRKDGFDPLMCQPASRFDPVEMFAELMNIVESRIENAPLRQLVSRYPGAKSRAAAALAGREEEPSRVRQRLPGARAERDAHLLPPGRQIRRAVQRSRSAAQQGRDRRRGRAARHRQAARARGDRRRRRLHGGRLPDRPRAARPRHRPRSGRRPRRSIPNCCCGWST